jgi:hypothetical protein
MIATSACVVATFAAYMWQMLETKARFRQQVMRGENVGAWRRIWKGRERERSDLARRCSNLHLTLWVEVNFTMVGNKQRKILDAEQSRERRTPSAL